MRAVISVPPYDFSALRDLYRELYRQVNPPSAAPVLAAVSAPQSAQAAPVPARLESPDTRVTSQAAACTPAQRLAVSRLRIAFFGRRGGVGTSTAALHTAQLLANTGLKVVLFDAGHKLVPANRWQVFEERTFRGRRSDFREPREAAVADVTGDGKNDLIIIVHDRVIVYPQE